MELIKSNMLHSDDAMVPNVKVQKLQIDPQKFDKFAAEKFITF